MTDGSGEVAAAAGRQMVRVRYGVGAKLARQCGDCTLCCKVMAIEQLAKPASSWCQHCRPGHGCLSYATRPDECCDFDCLWLIDDRLDQRWKPKTGIDHIAGRHRDPLRPWLSRCLAPGALPQPDPRLGGGGRDTGRHGACHRRPDHDSGHTGARIRPWRRPRRPADCPGVAGNAGCWRPSCASVRVGKCSRLDLLFPRPAAMA